MLDPVFDTNLRTVITPVYVNEYARIAQNLQYQRFTRMLPDSTLKPRFVNLLESAVIKDYGQDGGAVASEEQVIGEQSYVNHVYKSGWEESEFRFHDLDQSGVMGGEGIQLLSQWTRQVSARAAYQPQHLAVLALRNGTATSMATDNGNTIELKTYDGLSLFSKTHPYNFKRVTALGTFSNLLSGAPTTSVPGFLPLSGPFKKNSSTGEWEYSASDEVSAEDAYNNLWEFITYIKTIKMADGITPRYLNPSTIIAGPRLQKMITTITSAQFISASSKGGGGGALDIKGSITSLGLAEPVILNELGGLGTREEYDWYVICEENVQASDLGPINIGVIEPWKVQLFTSATILSLAISNKVQAVGEMRMFVGVGQPQFIFKTQAPR
jgi:hypothetical protein